MREIEKLLNLILKNNRLYHSQTEIPNVHSIEDFKSDIGFDVCEREKDGSLEIKLKEGWTGMTAEEIYDYVVKSLPSTTETEMYLFGTKLVMTNPKDTLKQGIPVKMYITNNQYYVRHSINGFGSAAIFRNEDNGEAEIIYEFYIDDFGSVYTSALNNGRSKYSDEKIGYVKQEDVIKANREILRRELKEAINDEDYDRSRFLIFLKYFSKTGQEWDQMARK